MSKIRDHLAVALVATALACSPDSAHDRLEKAAVDEGSIDRPDFDRPDPVVPYMLDIGAVVHPGKIEGTIEFVDPPVIVDDVKRIMADLGLRKGFLRAHVGANAPDPGAKSSTVVGATGRPLDLGYEITVEGGHADTGTETTGIAYAVDVLMFLLSDNPSAAFTNHDRYFFDPVSSDPVFATQPGDKPATQLDIEECADLIHVQWFDERCLPQEVTGGYMDAHYNNGTRDVLKAHDANLADNRFEPIIQKYLAVGAPVGTGARDYNVSLRYDTGTDDYVDRVRHGHEEDVTLSCDQVAPISIGKTDCTGGDAGTGGNDGGTGRDGGIDPPAECPNNTIFGKGFGCIAGLVDLRGFIAGLPIDVLTVDGGGDVPADHHNMIADTGPFGNWRKALLEDVIPGASLVFELINVPPSEFSEPLEPAKSYRVFGHINTAIQVAPLTFANFMWMRLPFRENVAVDPDTRVDLADTYVMDASYVTGTVRLAGAESFFRHLLFDTDLDGNGDGVPDGIIDALDRGSRPGTLPPGSRGLERTAMEMRANAGSGSDRAVTRVEFDGVYDPTSADDPTDPLSPVGAYVGPYIAPLGSKNRDDSSWNVRHMRMRFESEWVNPGKYGYLSDFQHNSYVIQNHTLEAALDVVHDGREYANRDHDICMSDVTLKIQTDGDNPEFFEPSLRNESGGVHEVAGVPTHSVHTLSALGTPRGTVDGTSGSPRKKGHEGEIRMTLPEGKYNLYPAVRFEEGPGNISETGLTPLTDVDVPCRKKCTVCDGGIRICIEPTLPDGCTADTEFAITGSVLGEEGSTITNITGTMSNGADTEEQYRCDGAACPTHPGEFSYTARAIGGCDNELEISVSDDKGNVCAMTETFTNASTDPRVVTGPPAACYATAAEFEDAARRDVASSGGCESDIIAHDFAHDPLTCGSQDLVTVTNSCDRELGEPATTKLFVATIDSESPTNAPIDDVCYATAEEAFAAAEATVTDNCPGALTITRGDVVEECPGGGFSITASDSCAGVTTTAEEFAYSGVKFRPSEPLEATAGTLPLVCYEDDASALADAVAATTVTNACGTPTIEAERVAGSEDCSAEIRVTVTDECEADPPRVAFADYYDVQIGHSPPEIRRSGTVDECLASVAAAKSDAIAATELVDGCDPLTPQADITGSTCHANIDVYYDDSCVARSNTVTFTNHQIGDNGLSVATDATLYDECFASPAEAAAQVQGRSEPVDGCDPSESARITREDSCTVDVQYDVANARCGASAGHLYAGLTLSNEAEILAPIAPTEAFCGEDAAIDWFRANTDVNGCSDYSLEFEVIYGGCRGNIMRIIATKIGSDSPCWTGKTVDVPNVIIDRTPPTATPGSLPDECFGSPDDAAAAAEAATVATDDCEAEILPAEVGAGCVTDITVPVTDSCDRLPRPTAVYTDVMVNNGIDPEVRFPAPIVIRDDGTYPTTCPPSGSPRKRACICDLLDEVVVEHPDGCPIESIMVTDVSVVTSDGGMHRGWWTIENGGAGVCVKSNPAKETEFHVEVTVTDSCGNTADDVLVITAEGKKRGGGGGKSAAWFELLAESDGTVDPKALVPNTNLLR